MEPYKVIDTREIKGQRWNAIRWNYFIDHSIFIPMTTEINRELPDEARWSKETRTLFIKEVAFGDFEEIVAAYFPESVTEEELVEVFEIADMRGGQPVYNSDENQVGCNECGNVFKNERGLAIHRGHVH